MKVNCPRHDDAEASCEVYETSGYCFSGCGKIPLEELGGVTPVSKPKEDVYSKICYINALPVKDIRGFNLPYDSEGYYLVWPGKTFYKLRKWAKDAETKYVGPSGHRQPAFALLRPSNTLLVCEGEINCLSLSLAFPDYSVVSPGSAGEFKHLSKHLTQLSQYDNAYIIVDKDPAGVLAAINAKSYLLGKIPRVEIIFTDPGRDCNDILVTHGREALKQEIEGLMSQQLSGQDSKL